MQMIRWIILQPYFFGKMTDSDEIFLPILLKMIHPDYSMRADINIIN